MVGAKPSFFEVHLIRALLLLKNFPLSRKKLVGFLGVGEGSVRTILKKLKKEKLVSSTQRGHFLTPKGKKKIQSYLKKFSPPKKINSEIVEGKKVALVVYQGAKKNK